MRLRASLKPLHCIPNNKHFFQSVKFYLIFFFLFLSECIVEKQVSSILSVFCEYDEVLSLGVLLPWFHINWYGSRVTG